MFIPESNTLRKSVLSLIRSSDSRRYINLSRIDSIISDAEEGTDRPDPKREGQNLKGAADTDSALGKGWRRKTLAYGDWIDVCSTPVLVLNMFYKFHPFHVTNEYTERINKRFGIDYENKEPSSLEPDLLTVELEAGPLSMKLLGSLFRDFFIGFKVSS